MSVSKELKLKISNKKEFPLVQVNLCQKLLFLHLLTHNMATDCSWNYRENYNCRTWAEPCCFHGNLMNNLMSYYGSVDARISVSEKIYL